MNVARLKVLGLVMLYMAVPVASFVMVAYGYAIHNVEISFTGALCMLLTGMILGWALRGLWQSN